MKIFIKPLIHNFSEFYGDEDDAGMGVPTKGSRYASGFDIRAIEHMVIAPGKVGIVPLGFAVEMPPGFEIQVRPRSGLAANHSVTVLNTPGTIDSDYRGECKVILFNAGTQHFKINPGMRICQFCVCEVPNVTLELKSELSDTTRGTGGLGSTGTE